MATARATAESRRRDATRALGIQEVRFAENSTIPELAHALRRFQNSVWVSIRKLNDIGTKRTAQIEVDVEIGTNAVLHGLGFKPAGWRIIRALDGRSDLYVTAADWETRDAFTLFMVAADTATLVIEVFV